MAINKKLIHFKTFETFNSLKLSANEENTKYTLGVNGEVQDGAPDILYQSIVWIKDTQKQWTHGQVYDSVNYDSEITWQELKDLKNNSQLVPGRKYRMIDYETTTGAENTQAAEHVFDLILTALDEKTLDEKCSAIQSERDVEGYFSNNNLSAWEVWYTIENDTKYKQALLSGKTIDVDLEPLFPDMNIGIKSVTLLNETIESDNITYFKWGVISIEGLSLFILTTTDNPSVNDLAYIWAEGMEKVETSITLSITNVKNNLKSGKGIIYRLIDEFRNDISYDFKNIKFLRKVKPLDISTEEITLDESGVEYYFYTFSYIDNETYVISDLSNTNPLNCCKNNVIQNSSWNNEFITPTAPTQGDICHNNFISIDCYNNTFDFRCCDNELGSRCNNNVFGRNIGFTILKGDCSNNIFNRRGSRITLNNKCNNNSFLDSNDILLQSYCDNNTFDASRLVTFDQFCEDNTLKNATDVVLGHSCTENIIKGNQVKFGSECSRNKISSLTKYISFKDWCCNNILGSHCDHISLGDNVWSVKLGEFDVNIYAEYISILGSYASVSITAPQNGFIKRIQHYNIESFSNTAVNLVLERDSKKTTYIRVDSSGNIMQFTDADIYNKQDGLISGTNIKTLNGESILGPGDITLNTSINWSILEATLITFTLDGVEYQAEEGMNFMEWCDSEYNTTDANKRLTYDNNSSYLYYLENSLQIETQIEKTLIIENEKIYTLQN